MLTLSVNSVKTVSLEHLYPRASKSLAAAAFKFSYPTRGQSMPKGREEERRGGEGVEEKRGEEERRR